MDADSPTAPQVIWQCKDAYDKAFEQINDIAKHMVDFYKASVVEALKDATTFMESCEGSRNFSVVAWKNLHSTTSWYSLPIRCSRSRIPTCAHELRLWSRPSHNSFFYLSRGGHDVRWFFIFDFGNILSAWLRSQRPVLPIRNKLATSGIVCPEALTQYLAKCDELNTVDKDLKLEGDAETCVKDLRVFASTSTIIEGHTAGLEGIKLRAKMLGAQKIMRPKIKPGQLHKSVRAAHMAALAMK